MGPPMEITRFGGDTETTEGNLQLALKANQVLTNPLNIPLVHERWIE